MIKLLRNMEEGEDLMSLGFGLLLFGFGLGCTLGALALGGYWIALMIGVYADVIVRTDLPTFILASFWFILLSGAVLAMTLYLQPLLSHLGAKLLKRWTDKETN